jgi:hypothetical protein
MELLHIEKIFPLVVFFTDFGEQIGHMKFHLKSNITFDQDGQFRCLATTAGEETLCLPL